MKKRQLLFSVTASDCDWQYMRGTGPGGQKRNKTESKVRCVHRASGAMGESDETRDQHKNKQRAFEKMCTSDKFKAWHQIECARRMGTLKQIEEEVERLMQDQYLVVEGQLDGRWVPIEQVKHDENNNSRPSE